MKQTVFVDTSALIALINIRDRLNEQAELVHKDLIVSGYQFVTSTHVITELVNHMSTRARKPKVYAFLQIIQNVDNWEIVFVDQSLYLAGYQLCMQMIDKDWSLTDCISIYLAKERRITEIFTHDHHFEQAGLTILL